MSYYDIMIVHDMWNSFSEDGKIFEKVNVADFVFLLFC